VSIIAFTGTEFVHSTAQFSIHPETILGLEESDNRGNEPVCFSVPPVASLIHQWVLQSAEFITV
jgi:hypothetical protein